MPEKKVKVNWQSFSRKLWSEGVKSALGEVVLATSNKFDDAALEFFDKAAEFAFNYIPDGKDDEENKPLVQ